MQRIHQVTRQFIKTILLTIMGTDNMQRRHAHTSKSAVKERLGI